MRRIALALTTLSATAALLANPSLSIVPSDYREPVSDSTFARMVRQYTTEGRFISPLVQDLPESKEVPSPRDFLGHIVGAPGKLTYYKDIEGYMRKLAAASSRVRLLSMGKSAEGREMILLLVADAETLDRIEEYSSYTSKLSDPRGISEEEAGRIISKAKPFYYLTGGLHPPETGSPEMLMELAYRLAVGRSPLIERIRSNVITMITPVLEVDGRERMVDWYYMYTIKHTDWKRMPPKAPPYWGRYTLHDNNRDGIQISQPLTRNLARIFFQFHPQVTHDLHESIPYLYISTGTGPYNDALDPIITNEWQLMANYEVTELTKLGLPGVWTWGFYTGWYPGYLLWFGNNHNSMGRFYETFGNAGASTFERELEQVFAKKKITERAWYRAWPPDEKVEWSFRNNINYQETGALLALDFAATHARTLLYNFWKKGKNAVERGRTHPPFAWIIPLEGQKRYELSYLIERLGAQGIEVSQLTKNFQTEKKKYPKGSLVIRMDQPYRDLAKSLLEEQHFPPDAEYRPYDDVAWTLPLLYDIKVDRIDDRAILDTEMRPLEKPLRLRGASPGGKGRCYLIPASSSEKFIEARLALGSAEVFSADTSFRVSRRGFPRGTMIVPVEGDRPARSRIEFIADSLMLDVYSCSSLPKIPMHELDFPRIALFHTWTFTQNSGWVRFTFDEADIPYTLINKDRLRAGRLRDSFDVIIIPDLGYTPQPSSLIHGIDTEWSPMPYKRSERFTNIGIIDSTSDMTGGMGFQGLLNLERFVSGGGTLITLGNGSLVPVEMGLVRHVKRVQPRDFLNPGSIVRVRVAKRTSNITCGYDTLGTVFRGFSPLLDVEERYRDWIVLHYGSKPPAKKKEKEEEKHKQLGEEERICVSGFIRGEKNLAGKPAILDIRKGEGRVVLFTFNPLHRYLTHSSFALLYSAILHWNDP